MKNYQVADMADLGTSPKKRCENNNSRELLFLQTQKNQDPKKIKKYLRTKEVTAADFGMLIYISNK